jgi:two-component system nitrogen regulation sensor histidine kinase NtrY
MSGVRELRSDTRILLLALGAALPGALAALLLVWLLPVPAALRWAVSLGVPLLAAGFAERARRQYARPMETIANLIAALRVGDFSARVTPLGPRDPLGLARIELNQLSERLRGARLDEVEAGALLRAVLANLEVSLLAVDGDGRIRFANRAAEVLLERAPGGLDGVAAAEVGVADLLELETPATLERAFPGGTGRWDLRRATFRQGGAPHELLVLSDVGRVLRQEERDAWKRIIRVLSHEINNSLTPIQSISRSLLDMKRRHPDSPDLEEDLDEGLEVIASRAEALGRFMTSYARLARLPAPRLRPIDVGEMVGRAARLEPGIRLHEGPAGVVIAADPDQLEQVLINLLKNAVEAAAETGGGVEVGWEANARSVAVRILDEGHGIGATANLFVPFFTTKKSGSGIGLVLSRHIAEAHGGTVQLSDREDRQGCEARLVLPRG